MAQSTSVSDPLLGVSDTRKNIGGSRRDTGLSVVLTRSDNDPVLRVNPVYEFDPDLHDLQDEELGWSKMARSARFCESKITATFAAWILGCDLIFGNQSCKSCKSCPTQFPAVLLPKVL